MTDSFIQTENIRIFGKVVSKVSLRDIESIQPDISTQMHLVRHYSSLDTSYLNSIIGKSYSFFNNQTKQIKEGVVTQEELLVLMKTAGSKFLNSNKHVANPLKVVESIKSHYIKHINDEKLLWIDKNKELICLCAIQFDEIIGVCGVATLTELPQAVRNTIKEVQRGDSPTDSYMIKTVQSPMIPTKVLAVKLKKTSDSVVVDTAFPGILSVDVPDSRTQSQEEYEYNKWYWDNHVFLI